MVGAAMTPLYSDGRIYFEDGRIVEVDVSQMEPGETVRLTVINERLFLNDVEIDLPLPLPDPDRGDDWEGPSQ